MSFPAARQGQHFSWYSPQSPQCCAKLEQVKVVTLLTAIPCILISELTCFSCDIVGGSAVAAAAVGCGPRAGDTGARLPNSASAGPFGDCAVARADRW